MVPCAREPRRPLASLSLSLPLTRACLASESIFPVTLNLKSDPAPCQPRPGRRGVCGDKNFGSRKNCDAGEIWSKTFGGGARVQRRQGGEPGEPAARSVETAAARVTRQRRRGRAGGFDDDVDRDGQTYRGCQAVSWPAAGRATHDANAALGTSVLCTLSGVHSALSAQ